MNNNSSLDSVGRAKSPESLHSNGDSTQWVSREIFTQLLDLGPGWQTTGVEYDAESNSLMVSIKETPELWAGMVCPKCSAPGVALHDRGAKRSWRHVDGFSKKTMLSCALPRGRCSSCGFVFKVEPDWHGKSKHFTRDFEALALTLMKEMTVKSVSKVTGENDQRLWRILFAYVEGARTELSRAAVNILKQQWDKKGI